MAAQNKAAILASLPVRGDEDPYAVTIGGFYRRWFNLVDDLQVLIDTVATIKSTYDEDWVPAWSAVGPSTCSARGSPGESSSSSATAADTTRLSSSW